MPERPAGRRRSIATTAAGLLLMTVGAVWWSHSAREVPAVVPAARAVATARAPALVAAVPGAPHRLRIPALHVDSPVVAVRAPAGTLVPPGDPQELGWWAGSAEPGAGHGRTLIAGHTVHDGGGALDDLGTLSPGATIVVRTSQATLPYRVTGVRSYRKGALAAHARRLFTQSGPPRLVVVTCTDWDGVRYLSNTVVIAQPLTGRPH